jgi:hypothetical protein
MDSALPADMHTAEQHQCQLGWNNILFGRLATEWMHLQHKHLSMKHSRKSAGRWAADMTYRLLQISHRLWMTHNGILHERDRQGLLLKDGETLQAAITHCYNRGLGALLPIDQHLRDRPLLTILAMLASDKYTWLGAIQLAHRLNHDERKNLIAKMRRSLENWLRTPMPITLL